MKKLILKCELAPGDIVMLTAAVRDLHRCYPGQFATDVRTSCPDIWEHNPHLTKVADADRSAEVIDCCYPLIDRANKAPYHCLHGFIEFLNQRLGLCVKPTLFRGDIYLSAHEKAWYSQVREVTGAATPFWIIGAGGKFDLTIKWWPSERYQAVVDYFRGRIQFVQVGDNGHHHPRLGGVIDLRGRTTLRELIRLVYHSQGVLCGVTSLMHFAAAVPTPPGRPASRPCVVVAGGREPAHWEAYPGHQFLHTNGALPCCTNGGCWKERTFPLRDGDEHDRPSHLCVAVVKDIPHCMELITPDEVIRRIELFFRGDQLKYLTRRQRVSAAKGIQATTGNPYDEAPLHLHNAGMMCDAFARRIPPCPHDGPGRGIVICAGGTRYFSCAWICINLLRNLGCCLPIECWHLGREEMSLEMQNLLKPLNVVCIDASKLRRTFPARILDGRVLKPYALAHSRFREILLLDADNVPTVNPEFLFDTPQFRRYGAVFWPAFNQGTGKKAKLIWKSCGLRPPRERGFETGQILVDKQRCWSALRLSLWLNEHADFYHQYLHAGRETFHIAFRKLHKRYTLVAKRSHRLNGTLCQHDFKGRRILQHRHGDKWSVFGNKRVIDFWFEKECRYQLARLRRLWDGAIIPGAQTKMPTLALTTAGPKGLNIRPVVISCLEHKARCQRTLQNLQKTDWPDRVVQLHVDQNTSLDYRRRQVQCAHSALKESLTDSADYVLFLQDDLVFNVHLYHNLQRWSPLKNGTVSLASLYNPSVRESACDPENNALLVAPQRMVGSQALLIARKTVKYIVDSWDSVRGLTDLRIGRLASRIGNIVLYHAPSLVQRVGKHSAWSGRSHNAVDFDSDWRA